VRKTCFSAALAIVPGRRSSPTRKPALNPDFWTPHHKLRIVETDFAAAHGHLSQRLRKRSLVVLLRDVRAS
jgi:hypothetical protein